MTLAENADATSRALAYSRLVSKMSLMLTGLTAGLAGGFAEVVWVGAYRAISGESGFEVARDVANTVFPGILYAASAPAIGLAIHFALSALLGLLLAPYLVSDAVRRSWGPLLNAPCILVMIWIVNFKLVLPAVNPVFLELMPDWVTFASKVLFGAAMGGALSSVTVRRMNWHTLAGAPGSM